MSSASAALKRGECPAAHSMDTTWFAVDAEGFVGVFDTGEDGGLPIAAAATPEAGSFDSWPLDSVLVARALADGSYPARAPEWGPSELQRRAILVLRPDPDEAPATYRDAAGRGYSIHEELGPVLVLRDQDPRIVCLKAAIPPAKAKRLADDPRIERAVDDWEVDEWAWEGGGPVYRFSNQDYGEPGNYTRKSEPVDPVALAELPDELRASLSQLTLPVCFEEADKVHLADHLSDDECVTYSDTTLRGAPRTPRPPAASGAWRLFLIAVGITIVSLFFWLLR